MFPQWGGTSLSGAKGVVAVLCEFPTPFAPLRDVVPEILFAQLISARGLSVFAAAVANGVSCRFRSVLQELV
jgi:hypothetical protein